MRWPAGAFDEGPNEMRIGIVGSDTHAAQLEKLASGRQIAGRQVVIQHFRSPAEVKPCQMLLLAGSLSAGDRQTLIAKYKSSPVLLASAVPEFCREGGGLNFQMEGGNVKFALNPQVLAKQKLTVDPRFTRLAKTPSQQPPSGGKRP